MLSQAKEITANRQITPTLKYISRCLKVKEQDKERGSRGKFDAIEF